MSTEESSNEDDQLSYVVKTIPWESKMLEKGKKMDKTHVKTQSKRSIQYNTIQQLLFKHDGD